MSRGSRSILITAAAFLAGAGGMLLAQKFWPQGSGDTAPEAFTPPAQSRLAPGQLPVWAALSNEQALAVERVMPGVVNIQVRRRVIKPDEVLKPGGVADGDRGHETFEGVGSGAVISKEGHIVTNWHVVEGGADAISVTLSGESNARRATLVDKDDQIDVALLRIETRHQGEEFTALRFGDSDKVKRGDIVLALGSPFNLRETVTNGIISHRERRVSDTLTAYLQTTCIINPGNSGGPLINHEGDIIGIVTRKLLDPEEKNTGEGYGLAIPGNDVLEAVDRFRRKGQARTYLGLQVDDWPPDAWQRGQPPQAVIVISVWEKSPAAKAGLRQGDVIESVNGTRITSSAAYKRATLGRAVGDTIKFSWRRKDASGEAAAVLEDFDKAFPPESTIKPDTVYGVRVRVLRRHERNMLHLTAPIGLAVESVEADSPLTGLLGPRMNILHVSTPDRTVTSVSTPDEFKAALDLIAATGGFFIIGAMGERDRWVECPKLH